MSNKALHVDIGTHLQIEKQNIFNKHDYIYKLWLSMFVDTQCFHLTITNSICQSKTINAISIIDFTDHYIVHKLTRCIKLQLYNDSMNNDNSQWFYRQFVYGVERYNDTMNNDDDGNPVIGPRKQQKLRRGFKQNSAICLKTVSSQNVWKHPQNCLRPISFTLSMQAGQGEKGEITPSSGFSFLEHILYKMGCRQSQ